MTRTGRFNVLHLGSCIAALAIANTVTAQVDQLLVEAPDRELSITPPVHATDIRQVEINFSRTESLRPNDTFEINLTGDDLIAVVENFIPQFDGYVINGTVDGMQRSSFSIAVVGDAAAGWFILPETEGIIRLRYGGPDGLHYIHRVNGAMMQGCSGTLPIARAGNDPKVGAGFETHFFDLHDDAAEPQPIQGGCFPPPYDYFDIAVFYTDDARVEAGGTDAIQAECAASVDLTWITYSNSLLTSLRPRLVHRSEVNYAETGSEYDDLDNLLGGDAGLDVTHTIRDVVEADFVVLMTKDAPEGCGLAPCLADEDEAYCIVEWDCAVDNVSFPHEIGHLLGCDHDEDEGEGTGCYSDTGLGTYFYVPEEDMWRNTVMSYDNGIASDIFYYSHPQVEYMGIPTGDADHDNVSVIFARTETCEGFRLTRMNVWVDFGWGGGENGSYTAPYDTVSEGVNRVLDQPGMSDIPTLHLKAGSNNESVLISKPMIVEACGGVVTIGQ